ncbi:MAG: cytosine deaminase [Methylobacteriaceae bacterium]|nr:cytosine deaminase [Methylobacteriaceae bacterium]MBV9247377.1 cytosine deaminase [Methylobacteriaceae bacterium]MBV9637307.1 cytosine deaminase [Methylobacteriaceae bacterium]MBV9701678.1 cytosine deaminase [Methylobacteriaceae bacterium]
MPDVTGSDRQFPRARVCVLRNARIAACLAEGLAFEPEPDAFALCDLTIDNGRIAAIDRPGAEGAPDLPAFDLDGGIALPRLVDVHTHIDKGHIWPRRPNPDGTFISALNHVAADREAHWTAHDVRTRMEFSLRCAFAHGTGALRTHIDSLGKQAAISWPVFDEVRDNWKGRIALQGVAIYPIDLAVDDEPQFAALVDIVARYCGVLGGVTYLGRPPGEKFDLALDRIFLAAERHGLDLDFHVDESASPDARTLGRIAEFALRRRFPGRIVAGHCCSLALADGAERDATIGKVAEAGIAVVSLPMCNMYLQDRGDRTTPRWRGVAPLHELEAAGAATMVASDNTRDPFYAYGDLDLIEVFREATRILHFDHSQTPWLRAVAATPAAVMGLAGHGTVAPGRPADLVLTRARSLNELLSRPQSDRVVLVAGQPIDTTLPDYRELDALLGGSAV